MSEPAHGTRRCYQTAHCACVSCRAANARYSREWYRVKASAAWTSFASPRPARRVLSHTLVNGYQTRRQLRSLQAEGYTARALAQRLGLHVSTIVRHTQAMLSRATVDTARKVQAFYGQVMG